MKTDLPKYFAIKYCDDSRWMDYIEWMNTWYNSGWTGLNNERYYGYDGRSNLTGTYNNYNISDFKNNPTILTLDEFFNLLNKKDMTIKKEEILAQIDELKKMVIEIEEKEKNPDFSKFIRVSNGNIIIKGNERILKFEKNGDIAFYKSNIVYKNKVTSSLTALDKLEVGDVFITKQTTAINAYNFECVDSIFNNKLESYYISNSNSIEMIRTYSRRLDSTPVYKINRE